MAEPRDSWSKIDIVARSISAIFLPVVLLIVGNWYADQQRRAAESRLAQEQKASDDRLAQERLIDLNQRNADRMTTLLKSLASESRRERILAVKACEHLAKQNQLPEAIVSVLIEVANGDETDVAGAATGALLTTAKTDTNMAPSIQQSLSTLSPRVYFHIRNEGQSVKAKSIEDHLEKAGFVVPGIQRVDKGPSQNELRFFRRDEEDEAKSIASALEKLGVKVNPTNLSAQYENSSAIRPRHYELWFAPDAL